MEYKQYIEIVIILITCSKHPFTFPPHSHVTWAVKHVYPELLFQWYFSHVSQPRSHMCESVIIGEKLQKTIYLWGISRQMGFKNKLQAKVCYKAFSQSMCLNILRWNPTRENLTSVKFVTKHSPSRSVSTHLRVRGRSLDMQGGGMVCWWMQDFFYVQQDAGYFFSACRAQNSSFSGRRAQNIYLSFSMSM